ncbi:hypothetical protein JNL27_10820 [bacterium]|nr:hypothetical protein [bacterium]
MIIQYAFLVLILSGSILNVCGQAESSARHGLPGQHALLFQVGENFSLRSFDGSLISLKKQLSEKKAWRLSIGLSGYHTKSEKVMSIDTTTSIYDSDDSQANVSLSFSFQFFTNPEDVLSFYYGYGVRTMWNHNWSDVPHIYNDGADQLSIGPIGFLGIEYAVTDRIKLSGEYGAFLYYRYAFTKYDRPIVDNKDKTTSHTFGLTPDYVRLGLSAYF